MDLLGGVGSGDLGLIRRRSCLDGYVFCMCSGLRGLLGYESRCFSIGDGRTDGKGYVLQNWLGKQWQCGYSRGCIREAICVVFFNLSGLGGA